MLTVKQFETIQQNLKAFVREVIDSEFGTYKTNQLPVAPTINDDDLFIVASKNGLAQQATKILVQSEIGVNGFKSCITTTVPAAAVNGDCYIPMGVGTYTNFIDQGGNPLVVNSSDGIVYFVYNGTYWTKIASTTDLNNYTLKTDFNVTKSQVDSLVSFLAKLSVGKVYITDSNGNAGLVFDENGLLSVSKASVKSLLTLPGSHNVSKNTLFALVVSDINGNIVFGVKENGDVIMKNSTINIPVPPFAYGSPSQILMIFSYGQSNSVGAGSNSDVMTTSQIYDSLMFNMGVRPNPAQPDQFTSLIPLVEGPIKGGPQDVPPGFSETPLSGCCETFINYVETNSLVHWQQKGWQFLATAPGVGGQKIATLSKGDPSGYYNNATTYANYAKTRAAALNKTINIPFIFWTQGGADIGSNSTPKADYIAALNKLISDYNVDLPAIIPQKNYIFFVGNQEVVKPDLDQDGIAQAQFDVMKGNPLYTITNPSYINKYEDDLAHYKPESDRIQGAYYGYAAYRWLITGKKPLPLYPVEVYTISNNVFVRYYVPVPPLKFDSTFVEAVTNMGFRVKNSVGTEMAITAVQIVGNDTIQIAVTGDPSGGRVLYGRPTNDVFVVRSGYTMPGGRGNLRDSQGDFISRYGFAMHNYSLVFNIVLPLA